MQKVFRILGIVGIVAVIFAGIVLSTTVKPSNAEKVWDEATTIGNMEAKNYFVIYSDLACPYCLAFENAIIEHEEEFEDYLAENDILVEVRMADFLYQYGQSNPAASRMGAVGAYCAKDEGKFWDYYNLAVAKIWNEYFKEAGKAGYTEFSKLADEYWINIGKEVGLGESFESCFKSGKPVPEIEATTARILKSTNGNGMPYFKFNNYTSAGFDLSWGWEYVKMYFQAGLES